MVFRIPETLWCTVVCYHTQMIVPGEHTWKVQTGVLFLLLPSCLGVIILSVWTAGKLSCSFLSSRNLFSGTICLKMPGIACRWLRSFFSEVLPTIKTIQWRKNNNMVLKYRYRYFISKYKTKTKISLSISWSFCLLL